jgi:S-adenosylmethionine hydrolase
VEAAKFGDEITDYVRFASPKVKKLNDRTMKGVVLKADKFGNLITNIRQEDLPQLTQELPPDFKIMIGRSEVKRVRNAFAEGAAGEIFAIWGSMGYLEIVANRAFAAQLLQATKGSDVGVVFEQPQWEPNGTATSSAE